MSRVFFVPMVECDCGACTILEEGATAYGFDCRDCGALMQGVITPPGVVGREYNPNDDCPP